MTARMVLVADDDPATLRLLQDALESLGYLVAALSDGEGAVEAVRASAPDLVLLDAVMPGIGGLEACRRIRGFWTGPIVVTSAVHAGMDAAAQAVGATAYLSKPLRPSVLAERLKGLLPDA